MAKELRSASAVAPISGSHALRAFVDAVFYGEVNGDAPVSSILLESNPRWLTQAVGSFNAAFREKSGKGASRRLSGGPALDPAVHSVIQASHAANTQRRAKRD
jgi:hypothetical protein